MRIRLTTLLLASLGLGLTLGRAAGADTPEAPPERPHSYALVSAVGEQFGVVQETPNVGSHLEYYRRQRIAAGNDILNRLVLQSLDKNVGAMDPTSTRVFLSVKLPSADRVLPGDREQFAIDAVVAELKKHEQERRAWDRIIVVTQAYRAQDKNNMATKLQGMGIFIEPLCQSDWQRCDQNFAPVSGPAAITADGEPTTASTFVAPYSYLTVWQLDAATLAVIARTRVFKDQKISTPHHASDNFDKRAVVTQMISLMETSIHDGLKRDRAGHVDVIALDDIPAAPPAP